MITPGRGGRLAERKQPEEDLGPEGCEDHWLAETKQPEEDLGPEGCEVWRARQDSNLWPSAPEAGRQSVFFPSSYRSR